MIKISGLKHYLRDVRLRCLRLQQQHGQHFLGHLRQRHCFFFLLFLHLQQAQQRYGHFEQRFVLRLRLCLRLRVLLLLTIYIIYCENF